MQRNIENNGINREIMKRMEYLEKYGKEWNTQRNMGKELNIKRNIEKNGICREILKRMEYLEKY